MSSNGQKGENKRKQKDRQIVRSCQWAEKAVDNEGGVLGIWYCWDQWEYLEKSRRLDWFSLVGFYSISTIVNYLMPNPLYTYILNI